MNVLIRGFNQHINSKTGAFLPAGQVRGTPHWLQFEKILRDCLESLGHWTYNQVEMPGSKDVESVFDNTVNQEGEHIFPNYHIYVHQTKREKPNGNMFYMQLHYRELFTIDTNGWGADASNNDFKLGDVNAEEAAIFCEAKSKQFVESGISKCSQQETADQTPERFILVPLQIPRDYTIKHHSPITVKYFLDSLMAWAEESKTHICIKMHPHNKGDYDLHQAVDQGEKESEFVHKVEGNINELIKRSSGLFVINSGTGFEALVHGKPVCTFGECDYSKVSFNADIRRLNEARDFIQSYTPEFKLMAYEFVWWYWNKHAYDVNDSTTPARLMEYLKGVL